MKNIGRPQTIPDHVVHEIRRRAAAGLKWGEQKVVAYDLGVSVSYVNQILRGVRRQAT